MGDPLSDLKSLASKKITSEAQLLQKYRALEARLSEVLQDTDVRGVGKYCTVEECPEDNYVLLARLLFTGGHLLVETNSSDDNQDWDVLSNAPSHYEVITKQKELPECKSEWLRLLAKPDILDSLFTDIAVVLQRDIAPSKEAAQSLTEAMNLPMRNVEAAIEQSTQRLDCPNVLIAWKKAQDVSASDPADAATRANQMLETLFKHILIRHGIDLPREQSIGPLYKEVRSILNLNPSQISPDVTKLFSGLITIVTSIGELRTHAGTAHGHSPKDNPIDSNQARLAVDAAGIAAMFIMNKTLSHEATDNKEH
jgi:hypothetical protein